MATAIRIVSGERVRADSISSSAAPFECAGCRVPVIRVGDYWINGHDPEIARHVKAFFRLGRGHRNIHAAECPYTPAGQVKILVASADAVEDSINPFVQSNRDGLYTFRMNIPAEEIRREAGNILGDAASYPQRVERVWTGRKLESFCRSAIGLAKLWQSLESPKAQSDLRKRVRIAVNSQRVSWVDFFFSLQDAKRFADAVEAKTIRHPVALLLHAKRIDSEGIVFTPVPDGRTGDADRISVEAYASQDILEECIAGQHYILFGTFWHQKSSIYNVPNTARRILYRNFKVKLYRRSQIEFVDVVDPLHDAGGPGS